jgi:hypothetical protein
MTSPDEGPADHDPVDHDRTDHDKADHDRATAEIPAFRPSPRPRPPADDDTVAEQPFYAADNDVDPDADLFEDEGWDRPRRTNRLTTLLLVGLLIVVGFIAGVAVQKHHDAGLFPGAGTATARNRAGGAGGSGTGGTRTGDQGRSGAAAGTGAPDDQQRPIVTGTVGTVSGDTITVTNTGGAPATVLVPQTATVTTSGLTGLAAGAPVTVDGTRGADGTVPATAVTSR